MSWRRRSSQAFTKGQGLQATESRNLISPRRQRAKRSNDVRLGDRTEHRTVRASKSGYCPRDDMLRNIWSRCERFLPGLRQLDLDIPPGVIRIQVSAAAAAWPDQVLLEVSGGSMASSSHWFPAGQMVAGDVRRVESVSRRSSSPASRPPSPVAHPCVWNLAGGDVCLSRRAESSPHLTMS